MPPPINFQLLFDLAPNPYMLLDRQLRYVAANQAYLRVTASRLEDLLGRRVFDVFPHDPDDPANDSTAVLRRSFERVLATGEPDVLAIIPYRVPQLKDGRAELEYRYWSATHVPIRGEDGAVAYVLQHTVDVTEVHRQQASGAPASEPPPSPLLETGVLGRARQVQEANLTLEIERRHLRGLFQQAPGFMCFLRGPAHVFEIANDAYSQLVGHREILGKPVREALPDIEGQGFFELLDRVFTTGVPFIGRAMRVVLQPHPGAAPEEAFLDFSYQPILDASGATAGILVQGYDISAQTRQEAERAMLLERERVARSAAEAAEERQRFLAESIPQQVWTALPTGDLDFVNQRVLDYFGVPIAAILGSGWQQYIHPDDVQQCADRWRQSLATGGEYEVEFRLKRADATYRWHLARALPLRGADGVVVKWFGTNTDMDDLTRTRDQLQKRSEFEQQLIGIVSHDLRNPLNAIFMATSLLLQRGRLDEQHVKIVKRIMSSAERAARLIKDFLDFTQARVEGRIPVALGPANIRDIARQVFEEIHLVYPDRAAELAHSGEETGNWDADRIAQLVGNLVGNAFQHGSAAGTVRVSTHGDRDAVTVEVHNDGAPIPPEDLAKLFQPFQRGVQASAPSGRSVGLGLYISREIAVAHGGAIDVRSSADEGTTFTVRLPRYNPA